MAHADAGSPVRTTSGISRLVLSGPVGPVDTRGDTLHLDDPPAQLALAVVNLEARLAAAGVGLAAVVRLGVWSPQLGAIARHAGVIAERFDPLGVRPEVQLLEVTGLPWPGALVALDAVAAR